jgi:carboxyl-terminal processing protease
MKDQETNRAHSASDLKRTDSGRPVYSGGGIEPDRRVPGPLEGFNPTRFGRSLYSRGEFANYATRFDAEGDARIKQISTDRKTVKPNFVVDDAMVGEFRDLLKADRIKIDEDAFKKDGDFIRAMMRFEIDRALFGVAEARRHLVEVDPQARVALTMFGEAQKLSDLSRSPSKAAH